MVFLWTNLICHAFELLGYNVRTGAVSVVGCSNSCRDGARRYKLDSAPSRLPAASSAEFGISIDPGLNWVVQSVSPPEAGTRETDPLALRIIDRPLIRGGLKTGQRA